MLLLIMGSYYCRSVYYKCQVMLLYKVASIITTSFSMLIR